MAFIGILIADLIIFGLFIAAICGVFIVVWGIAAILGGIVLSGKKQEVNLGSKKRIIGIAMIIAGVAVVVPVGYFVFKLLQMFGLI